MPADPYLDCPTCAQVCLADMPDCVEGHGHDCPDRVCTKCGTALFVDPPVSAAAMRRGAPARRAA